MVSSGHPIQLFLLRLGLERPSYLIHTPGYGGDATVTITAEAKLRCWRPESPVFWWWCGWWDWGFDLCSNPLLPPSKVEE